MSEVKKLYDEIIKEITSDIPLSTILIKLSHSPLIKDKDKKFEHWVKSEMGGYSNFSDVPAYRIVEIKRKLHTGSCKIKVRINWPVRDFENLDRAGFMLKIQREGDNFLSDPDANSYYNDEEWGSFRNFFVSPTRLQITPENYDKFSDISDYTLPPNPVKHILDAILLEILGQLNQLKDKAPGDTAKPEIKEPAEKAGKEKEYKSILPAPKDTQWKNIKIRITKEGKISLTVERIEKTRNLKLFLELIKLPDYLKKLFLEILHSPTGLIEEKEKRNFKQNVSDLRKVLKDAFGITDDPIPSHEAKTYKAKFLTQSDLEKSSSTEDYPFSEDNTPKGIKPYQSPYQ